MPDNSSAPNNTNHIADTPVSAGNASTPIGNASTPTGNVSTPTGNTPVSTEDTAAPAADPASAAGSQNQSAVLRFFDRFTPYFKHPVLSVLIGCAIGIISFVAADIVYPAITNVPKVSFTAENYSAVDPAVYNESIVDLDLDTLARYRAIVPNKTDKSGNAVRYSVICGDAKNPGHGDFVLRLENHGKAQAGLKRFDIYVLDYQPIGSGEFTIEKDSKVSKPDDYVVLYGSVDPLIKSSEARRVLQTDTEQLELSGTPINTSLSPGEHGTYYLQASFLKYGCYEIAFRVTYEHNGTVYFRTSKEPVYIFYDSPDCLPDQERS